MNSVQIGQKSYEMPPRDGFTLAFRAEETARARLGTFRSRICGSASPTRTRSASFMNIRVADTAKRSPQVRLAGA